MHTTSVTAANHHPLKNNPFVGEPRHIADENLTANGHRLISLICSEYGTDGHIEFTLQRIGDFLHRSRRTASRIINELIRAGLITTKRTGRALIFYLSDIVYNRIRKLGAPSRVDTNGNSESPKAAPQGGRTLLKNIDEKKEHKKKAAPVFFSKKIDQYLGAQAEQIKTSVDAIAGLPRKPKAAFDAVQAVFWGVKKRYHEKAIADALNHFADPAVWAHVRNPWGEFKAILKTKSGNYCAQDAEKASNEHKKGLINILNLKSL